MLHPNQWSFRNPHGLPVRISLPGQMSEQGMVLEPGQAITFAATGGEGGITVYDAKSGRVLSAGKVQDVARPGDAA